MNIIEPNKRTGNSPLNVLDNLQGPKFFKKYFVIGGGLETQFMLKGEPPQKLDMKS